MNALDRIRRKKFLREAEGYMELGMPQQSLAAIARAGDPTSLGAEGLYIWGESLRSLERYDEALTPLTRAAEVDPDNVRVRIALGWCYKRLGRIDLAVESLETALAFEPNEPLLRYNLACYLSLLGEKRRSLRYLSQALSIAPGYRDLIDDESDFDPLRCDPDFQALCQKVQG